MGKYMRKRAGRAPAAELAQVVVGVRTRSRSAAFASAAAAAPAGPAPKRPRKQAAAHAEEEAGHGDGGGCYLRLRSRRLFMAAAAEAPCPVPAEEKAAASFPAGAASSRASGEAPVAVVAAGVSRCSSTASSVDVVVAAARVRSGGATEARLREESDVGSAVSDSECGRQRREATPSSRPPADLSDEGSSSQASLVANDKEHRHGSSSANVTPAAVACRARTPPEEEIEAFFAAAEKAEAERFSAKYNFDFARGLPLAGGGRFEWTTVASG
ncbi:unnamed protein product [Urochloa decumbens]|uniref:Cyclin-dependent kinase inhibitor domain-containing protein n=1 Tax=Urochloa decumbens TaxID=240449 RepID=A0ABC9DQS8_9POAL